MLTPCLHYCVASFDYGDSRARDVGQGMISIVTVEFRYYVVTIILGNLGNVSYKGLRQSRLISFQ